MIVGAVAHGVSWRAIVTKDDGVTVLWRSQYTYRTYAMALRAGELWARRQALTGVSR